MMEKIFEQFIKNGLLTKTKYIYMYDNAGDYIYKVESGCREVLKRKIKESKVLELKRDTKEKVWLIFYNNYFVGAFE